MKKIVAGPECFPDSVADRIRAIADGGGRIAVPVGELTDAEMKLIAEAKVPAEHDYDYKDD